MVTVESLALTASMTFWASSPVTSVWVPPSGVPGRRCPRPNLCRPMRRRRTPTQKGGVGGREAAPPPMMAPAAGPTRRRGRASWGSWQDLLRGGRQRHRAAGWTSTVRAAPVRNLSRTHPLRSEVGRPTGIPATARTHSPPARKVEHRDRRRRHRDPPPGEVLDHLFHRRVVPDDRHNPRPGSRARAIRRRAPHRRCMPRARRATTSRPSPLATASHVSCARRATETTARSGTRSCSTSHGPIAGACRRPRGASGRSSSGRSFDQSDLAWRMRTRVRAVTRPLSGDVGRLASAQPRDDGEESDEAGDGEASPWDPRRPGRLR